MRHFEIPARMGPPYQLTREAYHRMAETGILDPNERTELLDGEIVRMAPIGSRHARTVADVDHFFDRALGEKAVVWSQAPLALGERNEPQPDVLVLRPREDRYGDEVPKPSDVLLLVEVSDSTIATDCGPKLRLYADAGIEEYWVVDLITNALLIHRRPIGIKYDEVIRLTASKSRVQSAAPLAFPDCHLPLARIFG